MSRSVPKTLPVLDQACVDAALEGSREAFDQVVRSYGRLVYAQALKVLGDSGDAEDVAQETFARAYRFRVRLKDPAKFRGWLLAIARNLARDRVRRRRDSIAPEAAAALTDESPWPGEELACYEVRLRLRDAMALLPSPHRDVITMRYIDGLSYHRIQESLGISNGALRGLLGRGLRRLRKTLGGDR
ncbi:MAG: RNA polymerase sigma-70 factor (ECF subfamily) [Rhodothermales bacterium]|jgi:RNA polymerase sigma-70 factor (ECF subfamily)